MSDTGFLGARRAIVWIARAVSYLVYAYVVVVEVILAIGFFLLLFGANPSSDFVQWIYRSLNRAMEPFRGMFNPVELTGNNNQEVASVFDASILFAMIIYLLLAAVVSAFISWLSFRLHKLDVDRQQLEREQAQQAALDRAPTSGVPPTTTDRT